MKMIKFKYWGSMLGVLLLLITLTCAAKKAEAEDKKALTKGEFIEQLSADKLMKDKIKELVSWTVGYDVSKVSKVKLTPTITYVKAIPKRMPPDGNTVLEIFASVYDPGGPENIAGVRADLSPIGRLANTKMIDEGSYGDRVADDGVFTVQTNVAPKTTLGPKEIPVSVANNRGWLARAKTTLDVEKNPAIIDVKFLPEKILPDDQTLATIIVEIDNPGRVEDLKSVTADFRAFGYTELLPLRNDGEGGDVVAGDNNFLGPFVVASFTRAGDYRIRIGGSNLVGGYIDRDVVLKVTR